MEEQATKKAYVAPTLTVHGDVAQITLGGANGAVADSNFNGFNNRNTGVS